MGKNIINRPGEHVELENSLWVTQHLFPTLASLFRKTLLQSQSCSGESKLILLKAKLLPVNPSLTQFFDFPNPAFPVPGQCGAVSSHSHPAAQAPRAGSPGLRTLQSKSLSLSSALHLPWGLCSVSSKKKKKKKEITNCLRHFSPTGTRG